MEIHITRTEKLLKLMNNFNFGFRPAKTNACNVICDTEPNYQQNVKNCKAFEQRQDDRGVARANGNVIYLTLIFQSFEFAKPSV